MRDYRFALAAEPVDERADTHLVFAVGTLEFVDLGMNQRFEFDRTCERALDPFAHGLDFAADSLADLANPIFGQVFGFSKAECRLGDRLRGEAHLLRATHHRGEGPEQEQRHDDRNGERDHLRHGQKLLRRTDRPYLRCIENVAKSEPARDPRHAEKCHGNRKRARWPARQRLLDGLILALTVVIGGLERDLPRGRRRSRCLDGAKRLALPGARPGACRRGGGRRVCSRLRNARRRLAAGIRGRACGGCGRGTAGGRGRCLGARGCRAAAAFLDEVVGGLGYLRLEFIHRRGEVDVLNAVEVEFEGLFEFLVHVAVDGRRGVWFTRHAATTLY